MTRKLREATGRWLMEENSRKLAAMEHVVTVLIDADHPHAEAYLELYKPTDPTSYTDILEKAQSLGDTDTVTMLQRYGKESLAM
jgi:hypothetical protein